MKHCGNCANYDRTKQKHTEICGKCTSRFPDPRDIGPSKWSPIPATNADRIRMMSDEELLQFILSIADDGWPFACQHKPECNPGAPSLTACNECFAQWLQQPAKEDQP